MKRANEIESRLFLPQLPRSLLIHTLIQFHQLTLHGVPLLHLTRDFVCGSLLLTLFQAFYFLLCEISFKSRATAIAFMVPGQSTAILRSRYLRGFSKSYSGWVNGSTQLRSPFSVDCLQIWQTSACWQSTRLIVYTLRYIIWTHLSLFGWTQAKIFEPAPNDYGKNRKGQRVKAQTFKPLHAIQVYATSFLGFKNSLLMV